MNTEARKILIKNIFGPSSANEFEKTALELFNFQSQNNIIYKKYIELLGINPHNISSVRHIPFLPVSLFKTHKVFTGPEPGKTVFRSSGTGKSGASFHYVADTKLYKKSYFKCFKMFYGSPKNYCILALLPSYLERSDSSLVYMASGLIKKSARRQSGFYLYNIDKLVSTLKEAVTTGINVLLLGVSFALLDLAVKYNLKLGNATVMETGGMKGRKREMTREELHEILKYGLGVDEIHSEYGMTELLSQAYSKSGGSFVSPPWMKVLIRDPYNPFSYLDHGRTGGLNIIDLANIDSCAFIETADLGRTQEDGKFEVLGRFDNSDLRGCNLLA